MYHTATLLLTVDILPASGVQYFDLVFFAMLVGELGVAEPWIKHF
jgi:hypothetical protein